MRKRVKVTDKHGKNPFWLIESLPDRPLFSDCPVKPSKKTIEAAEELYLKFAYDPPTYISSKDEQIIFEWNYYKPGKFVNEKRLYYSKELIIKDPINMEWKTYHYPV